MTFYIHDTFNDERENMDQVAKSVQSVIDTSRLYVTCMFPGEELCVNLLHVIGHVVVYDPDSRMYTCEFDNTPASRILTDWGRVYNYTGYTGHPQVVHGDGDRITITQIVLDHRCNETRFA